MPLFPEQVPEHDRKLVGLVIETEAFGPRDKFLLGFAHLGHAGEIALDVSGEDRDARAGKALRQHLQRDGLSCYCRSDDQSMAGGKPKLQNFRIATLSDSDRAFF